MAHRTQYINGEKKDRTGTFLEINFGHEIFKQALGIDRNFVYLLPPGESIVSNNETRIESDRMTDNSEY
jgi:hypothetical protein